VHDRSAVPQLLDALTRQPEEIARVTPAETSPRELRRRGPKLGLRRTALRFSAIASAARAAHSGEQLCRQTDLLGHLRALDVEKA